MESDANTKDSMHAGGLLGGTAAIMFSMRSLLISSEDKTFHSSENSKKWTCEQPKLGPPETPQKIKYPPKVGETK
eukprot:2215125-Amphidinium_carterae.1